LSEQYLLGADAAGHRTSLIGYSDGTLDSILQVSAATVLVTYTMYTVVHPQLVYTVPICTFGLFRYILRVKSGNSGDPTESLIRDVPLLCVSILWALLVGWSIYL
jgi:decaprenyl-phosphate phosphoribosyltransferase